MAAPCIFEQLEPDNTVLQVTARHVVPMTDDLVLRVFHRTTGSGRSALLNRAAVAELHAALGAWLDDGWPGVTKVAT
jgi:hypothetical protein